MMNLPHVCDASNCHHEYSRQLNPEIDAVRSDDNLLRLISCNNTETDHHSSAHHSGDDDDLLITTQSPLSVIHFQAESLIRQVDIIDNISRRQRQESNAVGAVEDMMTDSLSCLDGLRALTANDNKSENGDCNEDLFLESTPNQSLALADDLSSCADEEMYFSRSANADLIQRTIPINCNVPNDYFSDKDIIIESLQNRLRLCYQAVSSIQANADLKQDMLQLKVLKLQNELAIERCKNSRLVVQLERMKAQLITKTDEIVAYGANITKAESNNCKNNDLTVETHLNSLVLRCQQTLSENLTLKKTLFKGRTCPSCSQIFTQGHNKSEQSSTDRATIATCSPIPKVRIKSENVTTWSSSNDTYTLVLDVPSDIPSKIFPRSTTKDKSIPINRRPTYQTLSQKVLRNCILSSTSLSSSHHSPIEPIIVHNNDDNNDKNSGSEHHNTDFQIINKKIAFSKNAQSLNIDRVNNKISKAAGSV